MSKIIQNQDPETLESQQIFQEERKAEFHLPHFGQTQQSEEDKDEGPE